MPQVEEKEEVKKEKPTSGQWLWKTLKPGGCILVLLIAIAMIFLCLTQGRDPIKGYNPPQTSQYYAQHISELKEELEANVFPKVEGIMSCEEQATTLRIVIDNEHFAITRSALLRYYDEGLFDLVWDGK